MVGISTKAVNTSDTEKLAFPLTVHNSTSPYSVHTWVSENFSNNFIILLQIMMGAGLSTTLYFLDGIQI
jgi:hypothetical protein